MIPCLSPRDGGGVKTSGKDSADRAVFRPSDPLRNNSALRRGPWILNATLESLSSKFEGPSHEERGGERGGPDQPRRSPDASGDERMALKAGGGQSAVGEPGGGARLRSRADRAECRAAVAINDASISFRVALEAMLNASIARMKADEACLDRCHPLTLQSSCCEKRVSPGGV